MAGFGNYEATCGATSAKDVATILLHTTIFFENTPHAWLAAPPLLQIPHTPKMSFQSISQHPTTNIIKKMPSSLMKTMMVLQQQPATTWNEDETDPTGVYSPLKSKTLVQDLNKHHHVSRSVQLPLPFLYQKSGHSLANCHQNEPIISGKKAIDFAAFATGLLTLLININNNINNNNNNNNQNLNFVETSNTVANFNTNTANQINIMPAGGRRKRRGLNQHLATAIFQTIATKVSETNGFFRFLNAVPNFFFFFCIPQVVVTVLNRY